MHDVHSPFVFELVTKVIKPRSSVAEIKSVEAMRKQLLNDESEINVTDYGTAFGGPRFYKRKISAIARHSAKPGKYAHLLYRITAFYKPVSVLELGTSFGISTAYMSFGHSQSGIMTLEGCPETATVAKETFSSLGLKNIDVITGSFEETLDNTLTGHRSFDLIFFDGNHRKEPTLKYFQKCLESKNDNSIFIFDDINWSDEMGEAWNAIKQHQSVTTTVDLFQLGLVFFNPDLSKQHFTIRF